MRKQPKQVYTKHYGRTSAGTWYFTGKLVYLLVLIEGYKNKDVIRCSTLYGKMNTFLVFVLREVLCVRFSTVCTLRPTGLHTKLYKSECSNGPLYSTNLLQMY